MAKKTPVPAGESAATKKAAAPRKTAAPKRHSKATPAVAAPAPAEIMLDREEISRLAYSYWEARNYQPGSPLEDWFRAENELRQRFASR